MVDELEVLVRQNQKEIAVMVAQYDALKHTIEQGFDGIFIRLDSQNARLSRAEIFRIQVLAVLGTFGFLFSSSLVGAALVLLIRL